ncbi:MAG: hypothetical protein MUF63_09645 [Rhodobacteraceae bacterium]|nr:hypothetical protein [Paracoccaceae bacterium]
MFCRYSPFLIAIAATGLSVSPAAASVCDYRPTEVLRSDGASSVVSEVRERGADLAGGIFTFTNTVTGASLLGGGTGGTALSQLGGAATAVGNGAAAVLAAPGTVVAGAVAAVGIGAYEGLCFFRDHRVTDYDDVLAVMTAIASVADPAFFRVEDVAGGNEAAMVVIGDGSGRQDAYAVRKLYIVNGVLMHREWGLNRELGDVGFATLATHPE